MPFWTWQHLFDWRYAVLLSLLLFLFFFGWNYCSLLCPIYNTYGNSLDGRSFAIIFLLTVFPPQVWITQRPSIRPSVRTSVRGSACIFADTTSGGSRVLVPKRPRWCDSKDVAKGAVHEQRSILIPRRQGDGLRPALLRSHLSYWNRSALRQRLACNTYYFYFSWLWFCFKLNFCFLLLKSKKCDLGGCITIYNKTVVQPPVVFFLWAIDVKVQLSSCNLFPRISQACHRAVDG